MEEKPHMIVGVDLGMTCEFCAQEVFGEVEI